MGRAVYGGIYEPGHPSADEQGFRRDVLELVRQLAVPVVRYPGGNFVSGYRWEDGVGPQEERPRRLDLSWRTIETNQFGMNEFVDWCRAAGAEPYMAINLGTRGPEEARTLLEYANHPGGTQWSDLRRRHGYTEPHGIRLWCLGNEMDAPWQIGAKTPDEYARVAEETAKVMKWLDPGIELVACGSSTWFMPGFPDWERIVLERTYEHVDHISVHTYFDSKADDPSEYLARPALMERQIRTVTAACDFVKARKRSRKTMSLAYDEWNVWSHRNEPDDSWPEAPSQLEDVYTMQDALTVAGMYMMLLRHCDRVRIGCQAQLVNVIAPIMTRTGGGVWKQTIFHPMEAISRHGRGIVLQGLPEGPEYEHPEAGAVPVCDLLAVHRPEDGSLVIFAVNRSLEKTALLSPRVESLGKLRLAKHSVLRHDDLKAANTEADPENVAPRDLPVSKKDLPDLEVALPPASFSVLLFVPQD